jgi:hypothetical protein
MGGKSSQDGRKRPHQRPVAPGQRGAGRMKDLNLDMIEGRLSNGRVGAEDHSVTSPDQ